MSIKRLRVMCFALRLVVMGAFILASSIEVFGQATYTPYQKQYNLELLNNALSSRQSSYDINFSIISENYNQSVQQYNQVQTKVSGMMEMVGADVFLGVFGECSYWINLFNSIMKLDNLYKGILSGVDWSVAGNVTFYMNELNQKTISLNNNYNSFTQHLDYLGNGGYCSKCKVSSE